VPTKRPIFLYSVLAILFAVNLLYRVFYLPDFIHGEVLNFPFFFVESGSNGIDLATPKAVGFGIHNADQLIAVNGTAYTGTGVLGRAFTKAEAGTPLVVTIVPAQAPASGQRIISLPVTRSNFESWDVASDFVVGFLLPAVSLVLGFWVAFRRPRDPLAWLLLALMLSFPHILQSFIVYGWPPGWREAGVLYESTLETAFPIIIFLFGRFFPEPFPQGSAYDKVWRGMRWLCALPFAILSGFGIVVDRLRASTGCSRLLIPLGRFCRSS
jgi:hypothetical protein